MQKQVVVGHLQLRAIPNHEFIIAPPAWIEFVGLGQKLQVSDTSDGMEYV